MRIAGLRTYISDYTGEERFALFGFAPDGSLRFPPEHDYPTRAQAKAAWVEIDASGVEIDHD